MSITPHIVVQGAERAVAFYRDAFGAEEVSRIPVHDGRLMDTVGMHATEEAGPGEVHPLGRD